MDNMKESQAVYDGMTEGAQQGATMADLQRGYTQTGPEESTPDYLMPYQPVGGFVGRPGGWER